MDERERLRPIIQGLKDKQDNGEIALEMIYEARERCDGDPHVVFCPGTYYPPHFGHQELFEAAVKYVKGVETVALLGLSHCTPDKPFDIEKILDSLHMLRQEQRRFPYLSVAVSTTGYFREWVPRAASLFPGENLEFSIAFGADNYQLMWGKDRAAAYKSLEVVSPWLVADRNGDSVDNVEVPDFAAPYVEGRVQRLELSDGVKNLRSTDVRDFIIDGSEESLLAARRIAPSEHINYMLKQGIR